MKRIIIAASLILAVAWPVWASPVTVINAYASHDDGNPAQNTLDGNLNTWWGGGPQRGEHIVFEFEHCVTLSQINIAWYHGDRRTAKFNVEKSFNGIDWQFIYQGESSIRTLEPQPIELYEEYACFVRITGQGNTQNDYISLTEVSFDDQPTLDPGAISLDTVYASADDGPNIALNVIDGNLDTWWSAYGKGQYITFKLPGRDRDPINHLAIAWYKGNKRSAKFQIEVARSEGSEFEVVWSGYSSGSTLQPETYGFMLVNCAYVRIRAFGNTQNEWNSITEVQLPPIYTYD